MKVKKFRKMNRRKTTVIITAMVLSFSQNTMVLAANVDNVSSMSSNASTDSDNASKNVDAEYIEWDNPVTEVYNGDVLHYARAGYSTFNWNVDAKTLVQSSGTYKSAGESITVVVKISPSNTTVRVGVKKNDGMKRYVTGKSYIEHTFDITQDGNYKVFVENTSGETVSVSGYYK